MQGPINLGTDGKSIVLDYGSSFNVTYEDNATISVCQVKKQTSKLLLRKGFDTSLRHSKQPNDDQKDLLRYAQTLDLLWINFAF